MATILIVTDFPNLEYQKDSGTPTLQYFVDAIGKELSTFVITPCRAPRKMDWLRYTRSVLRDTYPGVDLVYGAGCTSTYIAAKLGRRMNIPSIGRLYGTYLYPYLHNPLQLSIKFEETLAFKAKCTTYVITNDGTKGDVVATHFGIKSSHFWINGVDTPKRLPINTGTPIIVSLARLDGWKRVDRIIRAFNKCLYLDAKLYIIGDGPERDALMKLASFNLNKKIFFMGQLPRVQADLMLNTADIFISTNDYSNVSNSLLQAMSLGKCCITLDTGDTWKFVRHDDTGLLAESEKDLPHMIQMAVDNPGLRTKLGINAMCFAATHFESWEKRIQREVNLVKEMIV